MVSIDSVTGGPCGRCDGPTAQALSHPAMPRDTSSSYIDVKVYRGGYRADTDLSAQQQFADEFFLRSAHRRRKGLSVVIAAFSAWKVSVFLFECGGPTYWVGGRVCVVMSADCARSRWELRVGDRASTDAVGNDADSVDFRYCGIQDGLQLLYSRTSVPASWLTVSHISGPKLISTISRPSAGRGLQWKGRSRRSSSLSWQRSTARGTTRRRLGAGPLVGKLDSRNFQIILKSRLYTTEPVVVLVQALANMSNHPELEVKATVRPPSITQRAYSDARQQLEGESVIESRCRRSEPPSSST